MRPPYPIPTAGIEDDAVDADKIAAGVITNAHIATAAAIAFSKLATDPAISRIKIGTYTGDGTRDRAITGVGFQPKWVFIMKHQTGAQANLEGFYHKNTQTYQELCWRTDTDGTLDTIDGRFKSLDADGFTVDDAAADQAPNKNGEVYNYLAIG